MSKTGQVIRKRCYAAAVEDFYTGKYNNVFEDQYKELYQRYWLNTQRNALIMEGWY